MKEKREADILLDSSKNIHMIGIGGAGMYPIAEILHSEGYNITGSDNNETDTLQRVRNLGIPVVLGHFPENVDGSDLVIYSAAIQKDNPELVSAKEKGITMIERSLALGALSRRYNNVIGVCGTHGKTTVTSMITQILVENEFDPSAVIGGKLPLINSYGIAGKSDLFVCESCEYVDTFLQLSPDLAVLLNIDRDHLEYFKTLDNLKASFSKFSNFAKNVIVNGEDENSMDAMKSVNSNIITFGLSDKCDYYALNIEYKSKTAGDYDLYHKGEFIAHIEVSVPGKHNILNSVAACAACHFVGATGEQISKSIKNFKGAGRRFEILYNNGITIADDYAHHPKELEVTLNAAMGMGFKKVIAVFQPFTFSRTKMLFDDFVRVLQIPDVCVMSEIMGSREVNTYGIYTSQLAEKIPGSKWFNTFEEIADHVLSIAEDGDLIITLGCGDIYKVAKIMKKRLENKGE